MANRTIWDTDLAGPGTETIWDGITDTQWDLIPDNIGYKTVVVWNEPAHSVMWGRTQSMALVACKYIYATQGPLLGEPLDNMAPGEAIRAAFDLEQPVDCEGIGITIETSIWSLNTDTDDGAMTLDQPVINGYITSTRIGGGTDGVEYGIINTVTTSDGRTLIREAKLPVGIVTNKQLH